MKTFRTLQLAKELFHATKSLKLKGEARNHLERASLSIALNLAEGSAKEGKERQRFFTIAMGSLRETQTLLNILSAKDLELLSDKLGAHLYKLIQNPGCGPT